MKTIDIPLVIFCIAWLVINGLVFFSKRIRERHIQENERYKGFVGRLSRSIAPWNYSHRGLKIITFIFMIIGIVVLLHAISHI